jgi:hypothetical protein
MTLRLSLWVAAAAVLTVACVSFGFLAAVRAAPVLPSGTSTYSTIEPLGIDWMALRVNGGSVEVKLDGTYLVNGSIKTFHCGGRGSLTGSTLAVAKLSGSSDRCSAFRGAASHNGTEIIEAGGRVLTRVSVTTLRAQQASVDAGLTSLLATVGDFGQRPM